MKPLYEYKCLLVTRPFPLSYCILRLPAPKIENIVLKRKDVSDLGFHSHYREHILI
jgi:hypothetical protein